MDKVIGRAVLNRDLTGLVALLSGRISFEMALKAIRAGIPILAAVSAPTSMALELAQELNLTLAGFVRGQRLNIYTHAGAGDGGWQNLSPAEGGPLCPPCRLGRTHGCAAYEDIACAAPRTMVTIRKTGDPPGRPFLLE